jgi:conjugal transfer pilus assembly protein TraB
MQTQLKALGVKPAVSGGSRARADSPSPAPGPEGEPQPASYPPQTGAAVPPPTAFYPGNGMTPPPPSSPTSLYRYQTRYSVKRSVTTKEKKRSHCRTFRRGALQKACLSRGQMPTRLLPGMNQLYRCSLRITGRVEMPNSKTYDLTGCLWALLQS